MLVFFSSVEVLMVGALFILLLIGAVDTVIKIISFLLILFIIKNIIQDVVFGLIKNHNNIFLTIWFLFVDIMRTHLFFNLFHQAALEYGKAGGFSILTSIIGVLGVLLIAGFPYLAGEMASLVHGSEELDDHSKAFVVFSDLLPLLILALECLWLGGWKMIF